MRLVPGFLRLPAVAALTIAASALVAGCGASADSASSGGGGALSNGGPSDFSYIGKSIKATLLQQFPGEQGSTWDYSTDNSLDTDGLLQVPLEEYWGQSSIPVGAQCDPTQVAGCDPDFKLYTCATQDDCTNGGTCRALASTVAHLGEPARSMCVGHSDAILDDIYGELLRARSRVDITSLTPPDGRFQAAIRNAVTRLADNADPPVIRMIFGQYPSSDLTYGTAESNMRALTRDVDPSSPLQLSVSLYRDGLTSWAHAKIIAIDGQEAIVGGMNMWTGVYLQKDPVHDLSIHVHGSAAGDAERFADRLWTFACADETELGETQVSTYPGNVRTCLPAFGGSEAHAAGSGIPILAVGRLGALGAETADTALVALLDASTSSIRIAQQDIGPAVEAGVPIAPWPQNYLQSIVKAVARGVDVEIVVSSLDSVKGYSNGWSPAQVGNVVFETEQAHPELWTSSEDPATAMCSRLHVTSILADSAGTWADGGNFAMHTKLISVDHRAFYLGSQNMYVANLAEFGFIYDDPATTQKLDSEYYNQLWGYSAAAIPSCSATNAAPTTTTGTTVDPSVDPGDDDDSGN